MEKLTPYNRGPPPKSKLSDPSQQFFFFFNLTTPSILERRMHAMLKYYLNILLQQFVERKKTKWMLKLQTAFPYGIHDKNGEEHQRDRDIPIGISFLSHQIN